MIFPSSQHNSFSDAYYRVLLPPIRQIADQIAAYLQISMLNPARPEPCTGEGEKEHWTAYTPTKHFSPSYSLCSGSTSATCNASMKTSGPIMIKSNRT